MKRKLMIFAFTAALSLGLTCCGNKTEKAEGSITNLDVEELSDLKEKPQQELTEEDYDFLLDQAEVFAKDMENTTPEKFEIYRQDLTPEELSAMTYMARTITEAVRNGKLTEEQLKRFDEMSEQTMQRQQQLAPEASKKKLPRKR